MKITHHECGKWKLTIREYARMTKMESFCINYLKRFANDYETLEYLKDRLEAAMLASGYKQTAGVTIKATARYMGDNSIASHSLIIESLWGFKWVASLRSPFYKAGTIFE